MIANEARARAMPTGLPSGSAPVSRACPASMTQVAGQGEEGERDESLGAAFAGLGQRVAELPEDDQPGGHLDEGVQAEPDQRRGTGGGAGQQGDDAFDHVVGDRGRGEQLGAAHQGRPTLRGRPGVQVLTR